MPQTAGPLCGQEHKAFIVLLIGIQLCVVWLQTSGKLVQDPILKGYRACIIFQVNPVQQDGILGVKINAFDMEQTAVATFVGGQFQGHVSFST